MLTGPGMSLRGGTEKRRSAPWAIPLFVGYWIVFAAELMMLRFDRGPDGRWIVSTAEVPELWLSLTVLAVVVISFVAAIGFAVNVWRDRQRTAWLLNDDAPTWSDLLHVVAWLQVFHACTLLLYGLILPYPLFVEGSVGSFFESASLQLFILIAVPLWFHGRMDEIGVCRPRRIGRMIAVLAVMFLLIMWVLDAVVTTPLADWFHLSLDSERERQIEQGIIQAKDRDIWAVAASVLVIGILVPIAEELLFRGVFQTILVQRLGAFVGIVLSSLWFALMHVDVALLAPLFVIGLCLGYLRHRFQSIWGAVVLHVINNLTGVLHYFH
ncbi:MULTISPECIES: CPBP family intramembrane glutamic endopeptidase [Bacillales]|jgi:membrane protease YdiL (CAAX protease family)|uniref:CPBP family intramembrane glutamic endopeptidase n=1 Tax=Brevibacillus TaxID=55080 RepID=UPI000E367839|nr:MULTISPECIES: type II CAAX endopeptidase family protein [Bacillales]REK67375.1 MAG: CPBP family intramembrane metalloprotease domain-containing protein [Brevibacillus sp.]MBR8659916.1 CPBP family intramembrane metalloprotease [Brevibacillus sp. NL20B1]MDT3416863.1 membrane protease YdiL (CAAX protease family) [Brevibacillus aydinogluensis]NNV04383.1 CPBP family intramembrane metalloprotease [Brevibacillus sp. MCWH]UFJ62264.1 CPBP family intramembrane metalloprotease [Anoxybacillus sediminis